MKILVTGADGLIGRALIAALNKEDLQTIRAVRSAMTSADISVGDLSADPSWDNVLPLNIDTVVHLAAKVSTVADKRESESGQCHRINTLATVNLARHCARYGVRRFVFVSTVKVLGEGKEDPYQVTDPAAPEDAYAISKWKAEQALWQISKETGMEVVIIRPPLVYGPGVKGNFLQLIQAIDKRWPLPLGAIRNRRSLIYLGNLVDAITLCLTHPKAAGKTFIVSDDDDVSTPELVRHLGKALGKAPILLTIPVGWMRFAGKILGKASSIDRLVGSFAVDITPTRKRLDWTPPYSMKAGIAATVAWYRQSELSK